MAGLARVGDAFDPTVCGDTIATGSPDVFVNGLAAARILTDTTNGHCHPATLIYKQGRADNRIRINGIEAAVIGDFNWVGGACNVGCNTPKNDHCAALTVGSLDVGS